MSQFFFAAHTFFDFQYWVWTETGTFYILVFLCTLKLLYQTHLEGKLSQVYYLSHEKKNFFSIYHPKIFFAAHRIFFLLSSVIKSCLIPIGFDRRFEPVFLITFECSHKKGSLLYQTIVSSSVESSVVWYLPFVSVFV